MALARKKKESCHFHLKWVKMFGGVHLCMSVKKVDLVLLFF